MKINRSFTKSKSVTRRLANMDITWCDFWEDCANADECPRALTPDVIKEMKMFWPERPISHFSEKPNCWKIKNNKGE